MVSLPDAQTEVRRYLLNFLRPQRAIPTIPDPRRTSVPASGGDALPMDACPTPLKMPTRIANMTIKAIFIRPYLSFEEEIPTPYAAYRPHAIYFCTFDANAILRISA